MDGNEIDLRLIHFNEQPLNDYMQMLQRGKVRLPGSHLQKAFLKTEDEQKEQLRETFNKYNSAKIVVDGTIIPNLVFTKVGPLSNEQQNFGFNSVQPLTQESTHYRITFATTQNFLYQIDFDRFYLNQNETMFTAMREISAFIQGSIKCFDMIKDYVQESEIFLVGTSLPSEQKEAKISEQALFILKQDEKNEFQSQQLLKTNLVKGLLKGFKQSIKDKFQAPVSYFSSGKVKERVETRPQLKSGSEEGVVAIKSMSNGLFSVIYSSGILRIWSAYNGQIIAEQDLLQEPLEESENLRGIPHYPKNRIIAGKITFLTERSLIEENKLTKKISIALSFATQSIKTYQLRWRIDQFQLQFKDFTPDFTKETEDMIDLGANLDIDYIGGEQLQDQLEVSDILYEANNNETHLWVAKYSLKNKRTQIQDLNNKSGVFIDREMQMQYESFQDQMNLAQQLQESSFSPYIQYALKHYYKRLTKRNRFTHTALEQQINDNFDSYEFKELTIKEKIKQLKQKGQVTLLKKLIDTVTKLERENSRISGLSCMLKNYPFRIIVRQLGISVLKEDTLLSSIESQAQQICVEMSSQELLSQPSIRHILFGENNNDNLILKLLGGLKFMLFQNQTMLDQKIIQNPNQIKELLQNALRETYSNETLHDELINQIEANRNMVHNQLQEIYNKLVSEFLEVYCTFGQGINLNFMQQMNQSKITNVLHKIIESGVRCEIQNIYELLRDLNLLFIYINTFLPFLSLRQDQIQSEAQIQESMLSWLKQIASLKHVLNKDFNYDSLSKDSENQIKLKEIQEISNLDSTDNISILSYFLYNNPRMYQTKYDRQHQKSSQTFQFKFEDTLISIISNYTFAIPLEFPTYIPEIVRQLISQDQLNDAWKYLTILNENQVALDFAKAYIVAQIDQERSQFLDYMEKCINQFQVYCESQYFDVSQLVIKKKDQDQIMMQVNEATKNKQLQFFLVIIFQLINLDERYSIYLIRSALMLVENMTVSERDFVYQLLFNISKSETSLDYMYLACTKISDKQLRRKQIGMFFERLQREQGQMVLTSQCYFSQDDIDLVLQYLFNKIQTQIEQAGQEQIDITLKWRKDLELTVSLLHLIAEFYQRNIEVCRLYWYLKTQCDQIISKFNDLNESQPPSDMNNQYLAGIQELLHLQDTTLRFTLINAYKLGQSFFVTDNSEVISKINKKKRGYGELQQNEQEKLEIEEYVDKIGYNILKCEGLDENFLSGNLKEIQQEDVRKALLLVQGRILVFDYTITDQPMFIVKVLSEMQSFDLAIDLAMAFKQGISYPLACLIEQYTLNNIPEFAEGTSIYYWQATQLKRKSIKIYEDEYINQKDTSAQHLINALLQEFMSKLPNNELIDLAQNLVTMEIEIPQMLQREIVNRGHVCSLIQFFLSKKFYNAEQAVRILRENLPESITQMAKANINLLVLLIQILEESLEYHVEKLNELKQERDKMLVEGLGRSGLFGSGINEADKRNQNIMRSTLDEFYQSQGLNADQAIEEIQQHEYGVERRSEDQRNSELQREIAESEATITQYKIGIPEIKNILALQLNED